jgi:condensin complex subunit 1
MESAINMKSPDIRSSVYKVVCFAVKHHGHAPEAQINIMQRLQLLEHLSEPMADCLAILLKEFDHSQLIDDILREIAGLTFEAAESKRSKSFSIFLAHFAKQSPRTVLKQFVLLSEQLDSQVNASLILFLH